MDATLSGINFSATTERNLYIQQVGRGLRVKTTPLVEIDLLLETAKTEKKSFEDQMYNQSHRSTLKWLNGQRLIAMGKIEALEAVKKIMKG